MKFLICVLLYFPLTISSQELRKAAFSYPDSVLNLIDNFSPEQRETIGDVNFLIVKGTALLRSTQYDSSIAVLSLLANVSAVGTKDQVETHYLLSRGYYFKGEYSPAIANILKAIAVAEQIGSKELIVFTKRFAGELYRASDNKSLAYNYLNDALRLAYEIEDSLGIAYSLNRLGVLAYQDMQHYKADSLFQLSMPIAVRLNDMNVISMNLNDMGEVYNNAGDFDRSLALYQQALELPLDLDMRINTINSLARCYVKMGRHNEGIAAGMQALQAANDAEILSLAVDASRIIADGYMLQGLYEEGITYYRRYMNYRGKLFEARKNAEILDLETKYATEKNKLLIEAKDKELAVQKSRIRWFILGSIILVTLLAIIGYSFVRSKQLQRQLKETNQTKDKLFAIVSHDLRSALTSFQGIGQVIGKYIARKDYDKVEQIVGEVDKESHNLHQLLDNLLNWSITQLNESPFNPAQVNLKKLVEDTCEIYERLAGSKDIALDFQISPDHGVNADMNALSLILRNLIGNAIKFTAPGGSIHVNSQQKGDHIEVTISDTGVGFTEEKLNELRKNKSIQSSTGTSGERGTGLGLTLCLEYLTKHRSELIVTPNIPSGTVFKFDLIAT